MPVTLWSPRATNACKKTARLCAWLTCLSPVGGDLRVRVVLAVKVQVPLVLLAQVLPRHLPPRPVAPVRAGLWPSLAPILA
jgi:hypothetical protein